MGMITLLTDFGTQDEYVGVVKGVIIGINPKARIVDITHGIPPQNVTTAAYTLLAAFPFFPRGTVHMAVVDPGVGTQRRIIAASSDGHVFLAPDNGLLRPVLRAFPPDEIYQVQNEDLFRHPVSRTFHGRDIFAPLAARFSLGLPMKASGRPMALSEVQDLTAQEPRLTSSGSTPSPTGCWDCWVICPGC